VTYCSLILRPAAFGHYSFQRLLPHVVHSDTLAQLYFTLCYVHCGMLICAKDVSHKFVKISAGKNIWLKRCAGAVQRVLE